MSSSRPSSAGPPPDGGWGWVVVFSAFTIHVLVDGFVNALGIVMEEIKKEYQVANATTAAIFSVLNGFYLFSAVVATALSYRIGCQLTCLIGCVCSTLGCAICAFASSTYAIGFGMGVLIGAGSGFMYCPSIICITSYFKKYLSFATGLTVCGAGVGTFIISPLNAILIDHFGWKSVFYVFAVLFALCIFCALSLKPVPRSPGTVESEDLMTSEAKTQSGMRLWARNTFILLKNPVLCCYGLSCMMTSFGTNGPIYFLPFYAQKTLGLTRDQSSIALSFYGILNTIGRLACGFLADRTYRLPRGIGNNVETNRRFILGSALLATGIVCCLSFLLVDIFTLCVFGGLLGIFLSASISLMSVVLVDLVGVDTITNSMGIILLLKGIGTVVGPAAAGWLADYFASYHPSYIFSGICLAIAGVLIGMVQMLHRQTIQDSSLSD